jgi:ketosteroid isomerase-like protein
MTPSEAIQAYCRAFAARDADAVAALFDERALHEMPLLRTRMVGRAEIRAGLGSAFEIVTSCAFQMSRAMASGGMAIAEGVMIVETTRGPARIPFAAVVEMREARIARLSLHLDARPFRLWSDGPVLAVTP